MVDDYRLTRAAQEEYRDWRDENSSSITFKQWLKHYRYDHEERA